MNTRQILHNQKLHGLYAITDNQLINENDFQQTIELALQGGSRIVQYRDKSSQPQKRFQQASMLRALCRQYHAVCIINDDIALAIAVNADGVHLGKNDTSLTTARQALGTNAIIGISCYNDLNLAIDAERNTANYVAFGAMFASVTKPETRIAELNIISQAKQQVSVPICTIGGITDSNIDQLITLGTDMAAVISGLFSTHDIKLSAKKLSRHFNPPLCVTEKAHQ